MDDADETLKGLAGGNARFARSESPKLRARLAKGQHPKAAILYCSDSREVAEKIFGLEKRGEIFGVRLAGNAATEEAIGSVVYAVERLHVPVVIVLGHTKCGAVAAAKQGVGGEDPALQKLISHIAPDEKENVRKQCDALLTNGAIDKRVKEGKVEIVGALHDMEHGQVEVLLRYSAEHSEAEKMREGRRS